MRLLPLLALLALLVACSSPGPVEVASAMPAPELLQERCEALTAKRVDEVVPGVFVARGYGLANTILLRTSAGHVVVDPGTSAARAAEARAAVQALAPGPVHSLLYTHSHIDQVGAAGSWSDEGTAVLATDAFPGGFFHQYGLFRGIEGQRVQPRQTPRVPGRGSRGPGAPRDQPGRIGAAGSPRCWLRHDAGRRCPAI